MEVLGKPHGGVRFELGFEEWEGLANLAGAAYHLWIKMPRKRPCISELQEVVRRRVAQGMSCQIDQSPLMLIPVFIATFCS